uniref:Uncharacterized protein n=1 Tax=Acrobeloides nanus TaxID=290746 RepID=A0A914DJZ4_9BILA
MQIKLAVNENGVKELIMIEMQGNFEIKGNIAAQKLGNFIWHENGTATLAIGHQLFEGKLVEMNQAFLMINKGEMQSINHETKECGIYAIVKRKVVFKNRPKSVIAKHLKVSE